jgi:hypothetical protein
LSFDVMTWGYTYIYFLHAIFVMVLLSTWHYDLFYIGEDISLPRIYYFGKCGKYNALVMDLLGPNLEVILIKTLYVRTSKPVLSRIKLS